MAHILECDWTWDGRGFAQGIQIAIGQDGMIEDVGALGRKPDHRMAKRALLPGLVNAHSHAFQRGLRGRGEHFPSGAGSFWSWRDAMYELVEQVNEEAFYRLTLQAFREMRRAGITSVGEFHYLHHASQDADYALDAQVLRAASAAGIRLVLLNAFYKTGGIGQPLTGAQRRFRSDAIEGYWAQMDALSEKFEAHQTAGVVVHSVRAAKLEDIVNLQGAALRRRMPFHIHIEEQRKEIEDTIAAYGQPPLGTLLRYCGPSLENVTAVHCVHTDPADMARFLDIGGRVCICPLTEANLGDGIPALPDAHNVDGRIAIGTDSNARICMAEEMRWLEYGQRLRHEARGVHLAPSGSVAQRLLDIATYNGARALGLPAGRISPGLWADFVALDLNAPEFRGCDETNILDAWIFGGGNSAVAATCVAGTWTEHRPGPG